MKNALIAVFLGFCLFNLTGCMAVQSPVHGWVYADVKYDGEVENGPATAKTGKACATTILAMVATGDASLETAKANGGITQVAVVDHTAKNILGIFGEYCTIVKGS